MKKVLIIVALMFIVTSPIAVAGGDAGVDSPFRMGTGARALALGGSNLATVDAATAPFWNPARLASAQQLSVTGFHSTLFDSDVAYQYVGLAIPTLDFGGFGVGLFRLGVSGIEKRDAGNVLLGEIDDNRLGLYVAYGTSVSGYDVGGAITLEHHSLDEFSATSSPGINLAVSRGFSIPSNLAGDMVVALSAGNVLKPNIQLDQESVEYPLRITGAATLQLLPYHLPGRRADLTLGLTRRDETDTRLVSGIEYSVNEFLNLRAGLDQSNLSVGAGLEYGPIKFDYALIERDLGQLHLFSLTSAFGQTVNERRGSRIAKEQERFNSLMSNQLSERNRQTVAQLVARGKELLESDKLLEAGDQFDRALFLARGNDIDTTAIAVLAAETDERLGAITSMVRFSEYMDSAQSKYDHQDYLSSVYFAGLAVEESPQSAEAASILQKANDSIRQETKRDVLIQESLWKVDSLLSYGMVNEAEAVVNSLKDYAASNNGVQSAIRRVTIEQLQQRASNALERQQFSLAQETVDSIEIVFPGHQWCADMRSRILDQQGLAGIKSKAKVTRTALPLSAELEREVSQQYGLAQKAFEQSDLRQAIGYWERVEELAPDYRSVREYLVNAYKYVGVELYGENRLEEAVDVWRKAAQLDRSNSEITNYIKRTENELARLKELSYDR